MNYSNFAHSSVLKVSQQSSCSHVLARPAAAPQDQHVYSLRVSPGSSVARPACLSCGHVSNCSFVDADFSPSGHFW